MQHCISSPSEATIKYKRTQIAQGPSCETDPLSPFGDFPLTTPIAVGVNLTCIRSKLVKKHSSMREPISKIFSKGGEKWRHRASAEYLALFIHPRVSLAFHNNATLKAAVCPNTAEQDETMQNNPSGLRLQHHRRPFGFSFFFTNYFFFSAVTRRLETFTLPNIQHLCLRR